MNNQSTANSQRYFEIRGRVVAKRIVPPDRVEDQTTKLLDRIGDTFPSLSEAVKELTKIGSHHTHSIWECDHAEIPWRKWPDQTTDE